MKGIIRPRIRRMVRPFVTTRLPPFIPYPASIFLIALCILLLFQGISSRGLWASHEARAAQNAQGMLDEGNWTLPRLFDGHVELQKPPAFYWLVACIGWMRGGVDALAVRLPSVLAGIGTVLLIWWHLRRHGRPIAGFVAAAMLASAVHFTGTARVGRIDVPLAFVLATIILLGRDFLSNRLASSSDAPFGVRRVARPFLSFLPNLASDEEVPRATIVEQRKKAACDPPHSKVALLAAIGFLVGLGLLLKGPIGVVLPAAALWVWGFIERIPFRRMCGATVVIATIALATASPWYVWAYAATDGEFFRTFILYHHFNRAFGGAESLAGHPFWYYLPRFAADFLPWTPLLVVALIARCWRGDADARFGIIWFVVMLVVLSLSRFKRADYLLPAYAGAAIFVGCAMERWYLSRNSRTRIRLAVSFAVLLAIMPIGWFAFDQFVTAKEESARDQTRFAAQIREVSPSPTPIVLFRVESHQLVYHVGKPVHTLVEWADLRAQVANGGPHYVVTRAEFVDEVREMIARPIEIVARNDGDDGVRVQRPLVLLRIHGDPWPTTPKD